MQLRKTWVSVVDEKTCDYCKAMNGTMLDEDEQFEIKTTRKSDGAQKTYTMEAPPFHPHCRCVAVFSHVPTTQERANEQVTEFTKDLAKIERTRRKQDSFWKRWWKW